MCWNSPAYFIARYCRIYDAVAGKWIPFTLWPEQRRALSVIHSPGNRQVVILKARQLGITWLVLSYALWLSIFRPISTSLMFSRRDAEAVYLLSDERLRGMRDRLPKWMKGPARIGVSNAHEIRFVNGSSVRAFPTTAGDSYTASLAVVDEADLSPDLGRLMRAVKPTVDNGGKIILLSRANKDEPSSMFKRIYRSAVRGENNWAHIFLPWSAHPGRTPAWYEEQRQDALTRTGSLDELYEQYPATPEEAMLPKSLDRRIPYEWIKASYEEMAGGSNPLGIPGLRVYWEPVEGETYVVGADTAEGNPGSDDSAAVVLCRETGQQVAALRGKIEPTVLAGYLAQISAYYGGASILVERNNHGHAVIAALKEAGVRLVRGADRRAGWLTTKKGKVILYDALVDGLRDGELVLHDEGCRDQLAALDGTTLSAEEDDMAMATALAHMATIRASRGGVVTVNWS